jgi:hypothetical protein
MGRVWTHERLGLDRPPNEVGSRTLKELGLDAPKRKLGWPGPIEKVGPDRSPNKHWAETRPKAGARPILDPIKLGRDTT